MRHGIEAPRLAAGGQRLEGCVDAGAHQVGKRGAHEAEREHEHRGHDGEKARDAGITPGQKLVDGDAALVFAAFMRTDDGAGAQVRQEGEAHVGERRLGVHAGVGLHGGRQLAHR